MRAEPLLLLYLVWMATALPTATAAEPASDAADRYAWQRSDRYVAPDFEGYFPDDAEAGARLDRLREGQLPEQLTAEQYLDLVRRGLRRTRHYQTLILADVGNRFIWNQSPQHAGAIELMYHASASPDSANTGSFAIYYGLSVVAGHSENLVRTLMEQYPGWNSGTRGRILWGLETYGDKAKTAALLEQLLDQHETLDEATVLAAYEAYERVAGKQPPEAERFRDTGLFAVAFHHPDMHAAPALRQALEDHLQAGPELVSFTTRLDGTQLVGVALVRGIAGRDRLVAQLNRQPRFALVFAELLTPQLLRERWLNELAGFLPEDSLEGILPPIAPALDARLQTWSWNRADRYIAPDFGSFFPDDEEAGRQLDALFADRQELKHSGDEILETFRRGLKRSTVGYQSLLSWFGSLYVYGTWPQHPYGVEMMYHASGAPAPGQDEHHAIGYNALYFGLTTLNDKPDNVLRAMHDVYFAASRDMRQRILWSVRTPRERQFMTARFLESLDNYEQLPAEHALAAYEAYQELTDQEPPRAERFDELGKFVVVFGHREASREQQLQALVNEQLAGADYWLDFTISTEQDEAIGLALVRGLSGRKQLLAKLQQDPKWQIAGAALLTEELVQEEPLEQFRQFLE